MVHRKYINYFEEGRPVFTDSSLRIKFIRLVFQKVKRVLFAQDLKDDNVAPRPNMASNVLWQIQVTLVSSPLDH